MRELSNKEISEVSGAFGLPGALWGGATAALGHLGAASTSGSFSMASFAVDVAVGAGAGFFGGGLVGSVSRYAAPRVTYLGGMASGAIDRS